MWVYRRLNIHSVWWLRAITLVSLGNIPVYLLLFKMSKSTMSISEAKLFLAGFLAIAIIYALLYRHKNRENNN
jgi:peptidoglycan/LPS O-acetylase OafA/YrhL